MMRDLPSFQQISRGTLDDLLAALDVSFVKLAECVVSPGWRLSMPAGDTPAIHYNLLGTGRMIVEGEPPIALRPHTLVVIPPRRRFHIEAPGEIFQTEVIDAGSQFWPGSFRRCAAGEGIPQIIMICGYFQALYGAAIDLFGSPGSLIVEQFDTGDRLDRQLKSALSELIGQEVGMGAMTAVLLKQILVTLLRRSLSSLHLWVERFPVLSDPQVARAFAELVSHPRAQHSVNSLADTAGLSRSAFMARFKALFGKSPMTVLRDIRMRQAALLLKAGVLSLDQIAHEVGYESYSGFLRAFRKVYGEIPLALSDRRNNGAP